MAGNQLVVMGVLSPQFHVMEFIEQLGPPDNVTPLMVTLSPLTFGTPSEIVGLLHDGGTVPTVTVVEAVAVCPSD